MRPAGARIGAFVAAALMACAAPPAPEPRPTPLPPPPDAGPVGPPPEGVTVVPAPPVRASVRVVGKLEEPGRAVLLRACGCLLRDEGGPCFDARAQPVPVVLPWLSREQRAVGTLDLDGDGREELLVSALDGALSIARATDRCAWADPSPVAGPHEGRAVRSFWTGRELLVAWSLSVAGAVRVLTPPATPGGTWGAAFPKLTLPERYQAASHPDGFPTFFAMDWQGVRLYGIDSDGSHAVPTEAMPTFTRGDPMDYAEVRVGDERRLWIATTGEVGGRLLALRGTELVDTGPAAGAHLAATGARQFWGSHAHDFDGDGRDDLFVLQVAAPARTPLAPRMLLQEPGGLFADVSSQLQVPALFPSLYAACLGPTCMVSDDNGRIDLVSIEVARTGP